LPSRSPVFPKIRMISASSATSAAINPAEAVAEDALGDPSCFLNKASLRPGSREEVIERHAEAVGRPREHAVRIAAVLVLFLNPYSTEIDEKAIRQVLIWQRTI
jgi:hypothetical protein